MRKSYLRCDRIILFSLVLAWLIIPAMASDTAEARGGGRPGGGGERPSRDKKPDAMKQKGERSPAEILKIMKERMNLTVEEFASVTPVIEGMYAMRHAVIGNYEAEGNAGRREMRIALDQISENTELRLSKILNGDQMKIYRSIQAEKSGPEKRSGGKGGGKGRR